MRSVSRSRARRLSHRTSRRPSLPPRRAGPAGRPSAGDALSFQHNVRLHTTGDPTVTLFNDGAGPPKVHSQSRGITVRLDDKAMTATLASEDLHSPALAASFEGNVQALANGDSF